MHMVPPKYIAAVVVVPRDIPEEIWKLEVTTFQLGCSVCVFPFSALYSFEFHLHFLLSLPFSLFPLSSPTSLAATVRITSLRCPINGSPIIQLVVSLPCLFSAPTPQLLIMFLLCSGCISSWRGTVHQRSSAIYSPLTLISHRYPFIFHRSLECWPEILPVREISRSWWGLDLLLILEHWRCWSVLQIDERSARSKALVLE